MVTIDIIKRYLAALWVIFWFLVMVIGFLFKWCSPPHIPAQMSEYAASGDEYRDEILGRYR